MMDRHQHTTATMKMNLDREERLKWLVDQPAGPEAYCLDGEGWLRVSRHSASMNSAYKCMEILRLKWTTLEFKVRPPTKRCRWVAEIWARRVA